MEGGQPPQMGGLPPMGIQRTHIPIGSPGVQEDGVRGKIDRETWETHGGEIERFQQRMGIHNHLLAVMGVGWAHSSGEAANHRGAKGSYWKPVDVRKEVS